MSRPPHQLGCFCPETVQGTVHSGMKLNAAGRRGDIPTEVSRDSLPASRGHGRAVLLEKHLWRGPAPLLADCAVTAGSQSLLPQQSDPSRAGAPPPAI